MRTKFIPLVTLVACFSWYIAMGAAVLNIQAECKAAYRPAPKYDMVFTVAEVEAYERSH